MPNNLPWDERFRHLSWEWDTKPYTLEQYKEKFEEFARLSERESRARIPVLGTEHVRTLLDLMRATFGSG